MLRLLPRHIYWPHPPMKLDYIYFHVGRLAVQWAEVEDGICALINLFQIVIEDEAFQHPRSTKRRIETIRQQLLALPEFEVPAHYLESVANVVDAFEKLAEHRQWSAHGVTWDRTWESADTTVAFRKLRQADGGSEHRKYDLAEIEATADECRDLNALATDLWSDFAFAFGLIDEPFADDPDEAASEVGV